MPPEPTRFHRATESRSRALAWLALLLLPASIAVIDSPRASETITPAIEIFDARLHDFIPPQPRLEVLAADLQWAEGPVWVKALDSLLFSDVAADRIYRWNERDGLVVHLEPSGHDDGEPATPWRGANGLALDAGGNLVLAQQGNRTLARLATSIDKPMPRFRILADSHDGKKLNSPNDLVVHSSGSVFFTDPPYGLDGFENSPAIELGYFGVFRLDPQGHLEPVIRDLAKPNGIALSPDEARLYVGDSSEGQARIHALALDPAGKVLGRSLFFDGRDLHADGPGTIDGMSMHASGYLFTSVPNGIAVLSPEGRMLGKLALGHVTNLAFDDRYRYLYLTTPAQLLRLRLN